MKIASAKVAKTSKAATKTINRELVCDRPKEGREFARSFKSRNWRRLFLDDDVFTSEDEEVNDEEILRIHEDDFMKRVIQDEVDEIFDC
ncbi:hypothetical protein PRIPAC_82127 [Pristionchus pacificus]|uniref:Uncharacterized protein n=1 Tax=Pristionchus pacificus TaxID=54126 RepID=A0A2A6BW46_PRIPA|nr:hypothetical protein PRIPAC_82127 [Pristionchus pacificus]|eukprot:PDM70087.1 hypothetical protein PRIPAC_49299 [Pristionchus pacificus]